MWKEFKEFIAQGNVLDLAVAVVIGAAFGQIVTALVDSVIMPLTGMLLGGVDLSTLSVTFGEAVLNYGAFIQAMIDFLIIAFAVFIFVKVANKLMRKKAVEEIEEEEITNSELYLKEIRDLLSEKEGRPNNEDE